MHPVKQRRKLVGFSIKELSEYTGLAESTIRQIENGTSEYKTGMSVAQILADTFGCGIYDLFTPEEVSHLGRPALTGRPINITVTMTTTVVIRGNICPNCWLELPVMGHCANCSN